MGVLCLKAGLPFLEKADPRGELLLAVKKLVEHHADLAQVFEDDVIGRVAHGSILPQKWIKNNQPQMTRLRVSILCLTVAVPAGALAQAAGDIFADAPGNAKRHVASGFVCPSRIGIFMRDAVGERDPSTGTDFCAYSALDGVYGTITLAPLSGPYDPKAALAGDFEEQEGTGGRKIAEGPLKLGTASVYARSYQTSSLESIHYRVQFAAADAGGWGVRVTMEYASPRDDRMEREFLETVYAAAFKTLGR